nr:penicillin-binding protein 2 [Patescibacteria group bacterium]
KAEMALQNAIKKHDADGGRVLIMNPYDGAVIAMAQEPSFNLNKYSEVEDLGLFRNTLVSDTYECGSIFKTITMAIGLDSGKVEYDDTFIDTGQVVEAGYVIKNSDEKSYGEQTMTEVLEKSLNTGAIYIQQQVGNEDFKKYVKKFGFGELSNIELPRETIGNLSNLETNRDIEYFTASFGQGITVTPLQILNAYATIANGGELLKPKIIDYFENSDGSIKKSDREIKRKVISRDTSNKLGLMLESNVKNGHGKLAGVPGYRVAGKTGTAQISDKEKGGYEEGATVGSFAGFGPVENPKFAMLVVVDNPKDVEWAESPAAPIFGELARFMFDYWGIDETEDYSEEDLVKFNNSHNYINYQKEDDENEKKELEEDEEKEGEPEDD